MEYTMPKIILASAQIKAARATALTLPSNPDFKKFTLVISMDGVSYELEITENELIKDEKAVNPHWFAGHFGRLKSPAFPGETMAFATVNECDDDYPIGAQLVYSSINDAKPTHVLEPSLATRKAIKVKSEIVVGKLNEISKRQKLKVFWNTKTGKLQATGSDKYGVRYTVAVCRTGKAKGPKTK